MDTAYDFIRPEFIDIIFFKQKNLVIFPYVDLKHLHILDLFTVGYNVINLESTILHNLKEIIQFDSNNDYSSNRSFYFIYNLNHKKIKELMNTDDLRCVMNTNIKEPDLTDLVNGDAFIFYNKKNKKFLNYEIDENKLEFENYLISTSKNSPRLLSEELQKIKIIAIKIYDEINQNPGVENNKEIAELLKEYDSQFWSKILSYVEAFFNVKVPRIDIRHYPTKLKKLQNIKDFSNECQIIVNQNPTIATIFSQLLHDYRSQKINPRNLDLEQLHNHQELYNYLRNRHSDWKDHIPLNFLDDWMKRLQKDDYDDFGIIMKKLKIPNDVISRLFSNKERINNIEKRKKPISQSKNVKSAIPSVKNFPEFSKFLIERINEIERLIKERR